MRENRLHQGGTGSSTGRQEWNDLDKKGDRNHAIFLGHIEELKV
jgi:hypothetical protein